MKGGEKVEPRRNGSDHVPSFQLPLLLYVYDPGTEYSDMKPSGSNFVAFHSNILSNG